MPLSKYTSLLREVNVGYVAIEDRVECLVDTLVCSMDCYSVFGIVSEEEGRGDSA